MMNSLSNGFSGRGPAAPGEWKLPEIVRLKEGRVLILAPTAADAQVTVGFLERAGVLAEACRSISELCEKMKEGCGSLVLAEEALGEASFSILAATLAAQPSWSDVPVMILISRESSSDARQRRFKRFGLSGAMMLIERPIHPATLVSTIEVAMRSRQRQYQVRDLLEQSREDKEHLEFVLQAGELGVWKLELPELILSCSETCRKHFGMPPEEELDYERLLAMIFPEDREKMKAAVREAVESGTAYEAEYRINTPSGERRWIYARGRVGYSGSVATHISGVMQNITARKEAQAELRKHAEELERQVVQRTAHLNASVRALEGVCYTIAHDLRAPLRTVQGFTKVILEEYGPAFDEEGRTLANRVITAAARMDELIRDLLDYAKLSHVQLPCTVINLQRLMGKVLENLSGDIRAKEAEIVFEELPDVSGNATITEQIFTNLISNSIKFVEDSVRPRVTIRGEAVGDRVKVFVRDNGIGIAPEHRERVFGMFQRLHHDEKKYSGTGVGLAIVKQGMERIGGRVAIVPEVREGTEFVLEFQGATPGV